MNDFAKTGWIRSAVDYAGLVAFAVVYLITRDILKATWAIVIGSVLGVVVGLLVLKKLAPMPLIAAASGIVFGGLSLIFKDSIFIKLKLTIVDGLFSAVLIGGLWMDKLPLKGLLGGALPLSDTTWRRLSLHYGLFFAALAAVNILIVLTQTEGVWVAFRFPGVPILALVFSVTQFPLMMKDLKASETQE
jgi:intracellular septation protein